MFEELLLRLYENLTNFRHVIQIFVVVQTLNERMPAL